MTTAAVAAAYEALAASNDPALVIALVPRERALAQAGAAAPGLPLRGVPFVVKDNIDVAGVPTTAGCPAYAYTPAASAPVVQRLEAAGAVPIAKVNLDQFATGLVGTRSPYGTPINPLAPDRVPGGSSSGSAVAVARGIVPFALGTDTAGSGRVPAAFTGTVGLKPTRGWLSTTGVVPAVRTLDCVSVFALCVEDAWNVAEIAGAFDASDPFSRHAPHEAARRAPEEVRIGIGPGTAVPAAVLSGVGTVVDVDIEPFLAAGRLLYDGPWVAERLAALGPFITAHPGEVDPTVKAIITGAARWSAADAAAARYRLAALRRVADAVWDRIDVLAVPTAPAHPTLAEVDRDPVGVNARLGTYSTFANLLDLCAVAVPVAPPGGVTILAPAWRDRLAAHVAAAVHVAAGGVMGATGRTVAGPAWVPPAGADGWVNLAVVGAHLRGEPLHGQLVERGAVFVEATETSADYRLYALPGTQPPKPGLVRVGPGDGGRVEVEVYRVPLVEFGSLVAGVGSPLAIGTVRLVDGRGVHGFVCEGAAVAEATDITAFGGWRAYRRAATAG